MSRTPVTSDSHPSARRLSLEIDTAVPHIARVWNYWLGGKDNYAVDRAIGDQVTLVMPDAPEAVRQDRAFMNRAVGFLAGDAGVRQFLDIGTGLPTESNTHEVAQTAAPTARIVYVDNDPLVLAHARALMISTPEGRTDFVHEDLRNPDRMLRKAGRALDF